MATDLVTAEDDRATWNKVADACTSLDLQGDLTWVGRASDDAYWISTTEERFENGNESGRAALIEETGDGWRILTSSSWIH